uniref:DNA primase n=1 Tax=Guillardia theta TaxID=55529 RepID=A0A7S4UQ03_GUITH
MFQWLSYSPAEQSNDSKSEVFARREFSFTLANDVYIRYLSYSSAQEWKADMMKKLPHKIDMGAVYTKEPNQKAYVSKDAFKEMSREFVLDIDLTDYQDDGTIKTNCIDPSIPEFRDSWRFMAVAVKVLDTALRNDFGFKHLLWVFSGRRGIHCWVCDERARNLSDQGRTAVAEYLNIFKGGEKEKTKLTAVGFNMHPMLQRAYENVLLPSFTRLLEEQGWLDDEKADATLDLIGDSEVKDILLDRWSRKKRNAAERWEDLQNELRKTAKKGPGGKKASQVEETIRFLVFRFTYPRLDINVSKMMNHLLKSPFCVHPKTQKVCVPLDPQNVDEFDPVEVPVLDELLREMDRSTSQDKNNIQTSLDGYVKLFKLRFLRPLAISIKRSANQDNQSELF